MTLYDARQFSVDTHGAYVTKLTDASGSPILFEQTMIDGKRRGGAHVCLPYFGPDAADVLPQHGFGRDVEWEVEIRDALEISCAYEEKKDELFIGLQASILYRLHPDLSSFSTTLTITNSGKKPFPASPGFHPYFLVDPSDVRLNGDQINLADFEPFKEFPHMSEMTIESGGRRVTISSQHLQYMVVWTNMSGEYLCVEPTLAGNVFDSTRLISNSIQPADSLSFSYVIDWGEAA